MIINFNFLKKMRSSSPLTEGSQSDVNNHKYQKAIKEINKLISINRQLKKQLSALQYQHNVLEEEHKELENKYRGLEENY